MSFFDDLLHGAQDQASRIYDQINPFDGGLSYNNRPKKKQPQPQAAPLPVRSAPVYQGNLSVAAAPAARGPLQMGSLPTQRLQMGAPAMPSGNIITPHPTFTNFQSDFGNFDQFSYHDKINLINRAHQRGLLNQKQALDLINQTVDGSTKPLPGLNPVEQIVDSAMTTGEKTANTLAAAGHGIVSAYGLAASHLAPNGSVYQQAAHNVGTQQAQQMDQSLNAKDHNGNAGSFLTQKQAENKNGDMVGNFIRPVIGAAGEIAPYVIPYGKVAELGGKIGANVAGRVGEGLAGQLAGKAAQYGSEAAMNAPIFAGSNAMTQYGQTGKVDPLQALQAGVQGGLLAGGTHGALDATGAAVKGGVNTVNRATDLYKSMTPQQLQSGQHINPFGEAEAPKPADTPQPGALTPFDTPEIIQMREAQKSLQSTHMDHSPERVALRDKVTQLLDQQGGHADAEKAPYQIKRDRRADIVLGPPASGKTNIVAPLIKEHGARLLDSDEAKSLLGDVNMAGALHQESDGITTELFLKAAKRGENIVQPLVGKNPERVKAVLEALKNQGYDIHLHYNHLDPHLTASRAVSRFNETGRFVDPHYVYNQVGLKPKETYDILKNNESISTYKAYDNNVPKGEKPRLIEEGANGRVFAGSDGAGRPLRGNVAQKAPIPSKAQEAAPNRLTKRAQLGHQNLSPEVTKDLQGEHVVRNTQNLQNKAVATADQRGIDKTIADAYNALNVQHIGDTEVAQAQQAIERADAAGRTQDAVNIHDMLSEHLTKQGQTIQAASLLYRMSPRGLMYKAMRDIKNSGGNVTPELEQALKTQSEAIKSATDQNAKDLAVATFHKLVADNIPQKGLSGAISVWKAGLLSGPITHMGNAISNSTFGALKKISDIPAAGIDAGLTALGKTELGKSIGLKGMRTKTATFRGIGGGTKQGFGTAKETLTTGIDRRNLSGSKYETHGELNFKNPVIQNVFGKPSNYVFRAMSSGDQPFYYAAAKNSLYDQALAAGKNQGLRGSSLRDFARNKVDNPTKEMAQIAENDAKYAVLSQDNVLSQGVNKFAESTPGGVGHVLVPFTKVPTNFLAETLDYTPVGPARVIFNHVKKGQGLDQRALSESLGKALTGTGVIVLGSLLASKGLLSGQYPTGDAKEVQRWKAEGITPNSVKIGDKWLSLNYLGPVGMLFQAGKDWNEAVQRGDSAAIAAISGFGKSLTQQSFLTGFSGFSNAIQDPQRSAKTFINSQAGSIVPNWLNQAAQAIDPNQREANNIPQTLQSRLPGARQGLPIKNDVYGNDLKARTNPGEMLLNPLRPSNQNHSVVLDEVNRLHSVDPNNKDLQVTPSPVDKTVAFGGKDASGRSFKTPLTDQQRHDLQKQVGLATQDAWTNLIQTKEYQALDDTGKANALNGLRQKVAEAENARYAMANGLGQYASNFNGKKASISKGAQAFLTGQPNITDFAKAKSTSSSSSSTTTIAPTLSGSSKSILSQYDGMSAADRTKVFSTQNDAEYKYLQAKYENDKANGKINPIQDVAYKQTLAKAKIGASYSKDTRDLYHLSKSNIASYLATAKNPDQLAHQLLQYDQQLYNSGLSKYAKLKKGLTYAVNTKSSGSGQLASAASSAANKYHIPTNIFAALIQQESGGNQAAHSPVGAIGLTQLMPATARGLGVNPNDPKQNLEGGAKYLAAQYQKFGRWDLALAAYNAGPGAVQSAGGVPAIPETQNYVRSILANAGNLKGGNVFASLTSSGGTQYHTLMPDGTIAPATAADYVASSSGRSSSGGRKSSGRSRSSTTIPSQLKNLNSSAITTASSLNKKAAGSTVRKKSLTLSGKSIRGQSIKAYKKPTTTKVPTRRI